MPRTILFLAIAALALAPAGRAAAGGENDRVAAQRIAQELKDSGQLHDYRVGVKFQDGVAWLRARFTSLEQKIAAERIASQCAGVERVISKLEVAGAGDSAGNAIRTASLDSGDYEGLQPANVRRTPMPARNARGNMPVPYARSGPGGSSTGELRRRLPNSAAGMGGPSGMPATGYSPNGMGQAVSYDNPQMPGYAWPSYAAYPNYAALTYPQQYSPSAWPYIGPFYPYPQVPLGWRKVTLEWDDGWWFLDFKDCKDCH